MTGPLKDIKAAAEWLGIPAETLSKLVSARTVPFTRPGGTKHIRFTDEHLAAIVAAGEQWPERGVLRLVDDGTGPPAGPSTPPPQPRPRPAKTATRRRAS